MHRDVKPQNIIVEPKKKILKLIDWGLAEFYHKNKEYNVRVSSRYFKGPELLVDNERYDYSLDIFSTGAMLAGLIFKKEPFFHGEDNPNQLVKITKVLGFDDLALYCKRYGLKLKMEKYEGLSPKMKKKPFESFINTENQHLVNTDVLDLLTKMLLFDHVSNLD